MTEDRIVDCAFVGRDLVLSDKQTIQWTVGDFENLQHQNGEALHCPVLGCHGFSWKADLYPRGEFEDDHDISFSISLVKGPDNQSFPKAKYSIQMGCWHIDEFSGDVGTRWSYIQRSRVIGSRGQNLSDGNLIIKVTIQIYLDRPKFWAPTKTLNSDFLKFLESKELSDVIFAVDGEKFPAHRFILAVYAPTLAELAEDAPDGTEIEIDKVDKQTFQVLLRFIYWGETPPQEQLSQNAYNLLKVADRFGCVGLKFLAESELIRSGMTTINVAEMLLFANAYSCALMKESARAKIAGCPSEVVASHAWPKVKESNPLLAEIVEAFVAKKPARNRTNDIETMDVSTIRRKLEEIGDDIDGTREMLAKRLKKNHSPS